VNRSDIRFSNGTAVVSRLKRRLNRSAVTGAISAVRTPTGDSTTSRNRSRSPTISKRPVSRPDGEVFTSYNRDSVT
jgi:hypothetical protein